MRFWQAFYGGPLRKPTPALQYAMWALSAQFHPKYSDYAEVFYSRSRQYLDADEMKVSDSVLSSLALLNRKGNW